MSTHKERGMLIFMVVRPTEDGPLLCAEDRDATYPAVYLDIGPANARRDELAEKYKPYQFNVLAVEAL